ncbi:hypothetical protein BG011_005740 [Mortierella polycephala]|uniref:Zip-domain-containing protein n=1 Tax=Mortierella polycephala TaxID=41804 RepID=A0A9P6U8C6_9FUNG|nr:hypothetical protein BG011_005740 [Mortierella polycephala]
MNNIPDPHGRGTMNAGNNVQSKKKPPSPSVNVNEQAGAIVSVTSWNTREKSMTKKPKIEASKRQWTGNGTGSVQNGGVALQIAGLIFIDTIAKRVLRRDISILQNHKFLAGSLGLGSGVMIFSSFYNLLPEAKEQLSSEHSIFSGYADAFLMLFFFAGVGLMALIHWIMHRFDSGSNSPGIEHTDAMQQYMHQQQPTTTALSCPRPSPQQQQSANGTLPGGATSGASTSSAHIYNGGVHEESDGEGDEHDQYSDSEYVDDEVTSLLNNAFLQIGKNPNSRMDDDESSMHRHLRSKNDGRYYEDDEESIEVVIADQKDKILRPTMDRRSDLDPNLDQDMDDEHDRRDILTPSRNSWSSASTRSQKPFAPVNKKRKSGSAPKSKGRRRVKEFNHDADQGNHESRPHHPGGHHPLHTHVPSTGANIASTYGAIPPTTGRPHPASTPFSRPDHNTHLRRTSFPRLKGQNTIYSTHDDLDHAVADDREHADLTEIGIQTALTIAVHKFPEGLITFLSTTADPCLGFSVFMAIAVHNLIEGYLIAFPLFIGLHSRTKAFALAAALGGLSQPLGAILGWFIIRKMASLGWKVSATGSIYAVVAGMMASIAVNGMWPQAVKCVGRSPTKVVQYAFFGGIAVMCACQALLGSECEL